MFAEARAAAPAFHGHVPLTIGSHDLHEVVSANRWGVIFAAQEQSSGAKRAIGVLDPALVTIPGLRASFLQSANEARLRRAANLVRVFEAGVVSELPYIVSEWMEGHDAHQLQRRMRSGDALPLRYALSLAVDAARAAAMLHASGGQHGRIALDKLFLRSDGQFKLIGIGLPTVGHEVWPLPDDPDHYSLLAPEQIADAAVGPPTDVYTLSLVAAILCSGANPLQRSTIPQTTAAILAGDFRLRGEAQRSRPELTLLLGRGLAREPEDRPDATMLAAELEVVLEAEGGPVTAEEWAGLLSTHFRAEGPTDRFREQVLRDRSARVVQALASAPRSEPRIGWEPVVVDGPVYDETPLLADDLDDPPTEEVIIPALECAAAPDDDGAGSRRSSPTERGNPEGRGPLGERGAAESQVAAAVVVDRPVEPAPVQVEAPVRAKPVEVAAVAPKPAPVPSASPDWTIRGIALTMAAVAAAGLFVLVSQMRAPAAVAHVAAPAEAPVVAAVVAPIPVEAPVATPVAVVAPVAEPIAVAPAAETPVAAPVAEKAPEKAPVAEKAPAAEKSPVAEKAAIAEKAPVAEKVAVVAPPVTTPAVTTAPIVEPVAVVAATPARRNGPRLSDVSVDAGGKDVVLTGVVTNGAVRPFHYLDQQAGSSGATRYVVRLKGATADARRLNIGAPGIRSVTVSEDASGVLLVVDCDCTDERPVRVSQSETSFQLSIPKTF